MSMYVKQPQIKFPRWQLSCLTLATALLLAPGLAVAHDPATTHPHSSSSMPMEHKGMGMRMGDMKGQAGMSMTGDVDVDFAANMRKHHQMLLMMAESQVKNGKDAELRELATQSIAAQKKEIAELDKWLAEHDEAKISQSAD